MPWCHLCQSCTDLQHLKSTIGELVVYIIPFAHLIVPSLQHILFYPPPPKVPGIEDDLFMLSVFVQLSLVVEFVPGQWSQLSSLAFQGAHSGRPGASA